MSTGRVRRVNRALSNERGAILLFALGVMVSLLLIAGVSSLFTRGDQQLTLNLRDATRALFIAEAGLGWAQNQLRGENPNLYFEDQDSIDPNPTDFGGGTFEVAIGTRDPFGRRFVTSFGEYEGIERSVRATVQRFRLDPENVNDCFLPGDADADTICDSKFGIVSHRDLVVSAASLIDSYRSGGPAYGAGNAKAHGNVATNGNLVLQGSGTTIRGGVYVGRTLSAGSNTLTQERVVLPPAYLPALPSFASVCGSVTNPMLVDCDPPFGTITAVTAGSPPDQTLTVSGGQTICMRPGIYCFRQIVVQSGGRLRMMDPATGLSDATFIHLDSVMGAPSFKIDGRLEYGSNMKPNFLRVFSRGDVEITGWAGAIVYGLFYLPRSAARLNSNSNGNRTDFFGAVYADKVTLGAAPVNFHVDEEARFLDFCGSPSDPVCKPAFVARRDWVENRW